MNLPNKLSLLRIILVPLTLLFMLPVNIFGWQPEGWNNWGNPANEQTARYMEYRSTGPGANAKARAPWAKQLTKKEASNITLQKVMGDWNPKL